MIYRCCDQFRRNAVVAHPTLNGLDYVEVIDHDLPESHPFRQRTLLLHFIKPFSGIQRENLRLTGGERIRVRIEWVAPAEPVPVALTSEEQALLNAITQSERQKILVIRTDSTGDHSTYHLQLVRSLSDDRVPDGFDPQLAEIDFSFKAECPTDFDCKPVCDCQEPEADAPEINYLAKDYGSFRRLLLDRLHQIIPNWTGTSEADVGVTLAELLAYVGDQLSYQQDAVATEAYLGTARRRVSLRRHAVLVDYPMHDGCNARAWLHLTVNGIVTLPMAGTQCLTHCLDAPPVIAPGSLDLTAAMRQKPIVFEPLHDVDLRVEHNEIALYAWGDRRCCLPKGSTSATLKGHYPNLSAGRWLLFEERLGPQTGDAADADPRHRQVVRLTEVMHSDGANPLTDPLTGDQVTEIAWMDDDALTFPLCVSTITDEAHGSAYVEQVSVARGNLLLADHGATQPTEDLGTVPQPRLFRAPPPSSDCCDAAEPVPVPPRYRPRLVQAPLTEQGGVLKDVIDGGVRRSERVAFDPDAPASSVMRWSMTEVRPQVTLTGTYEANVRTWLPQRTLLESAADADEFVAEVEEDGHAFIRFGDDSLGNRPDSSTAFTATYRVGNGTSGNVGGESIVHVVSSVMGIAAVRNPLPAEGGVDSESNESVRRRAPQAFRTQERAVTTDDYAEVTERHAGVRNAAARFRWTGSWHTVFITVDRAGGDELTPEISAELERHVDRYRMAGHDLELRDPIFAPLELSMMVCVKSDWFRDDVRRGVLDRLSNRMLRDGTLGLFHPDNFTFGDSVYLSRIYAAAHAVPGVESAEITVFRRQHSDDELALTQGRIDLGPLEIAQLDNDPDFPEHGVIELDLHGGK
jgi:Baseplate J-like protein